MNRIINKRMKHIFDLKLPSARWVPLLLASAWPALAADPDFSKFDLSKLPPPAQKAGLSYATDIRPLFEASCVRCHGQERPKAGLRLDSLESVLKGSREGKVVTAGDSKKSLLVIAVSQIDEHTAMPPKRGGRGGRGGPGGPGGQGGQGGGGANPPPGGGEGGNRPPGGQGGPGGGFGPPPKPLTAEQVGLVRAWIDQGAK
jgi:uncharacterized membrane protein YgcG